MRRGSRSCTHTIQRTTVSQGKQLQRRLRTYFPISPLFSLLPHCSLISLFPGTIPYYTIDSRTSLPHGRVTPLVHKPLCHCPMRNLPTAANVTPIACFTLVCSTLSPCLTLFSQGRSVSCGRDCFLAASCPATCPL